MTSPSSRSFLRSSTSLLALAAALLALTACQTPQATAPTAEATRMAEAQTLQEGDQIRITFPGTPTLDTTQAVRRDGRVTLPSLGELRVVGLTPQALEKELMERYGSQLVSKEVSVTVVASSFSVFVSGAVVGPGKIQTDRPITVLEAIMQGGGFDHTRANTRAVVVIRNEGGKTRNYTIDLQQVLDGKSPEQFYLRPSDIVFVPEKFRWF
jgi:polysaccharide biosynthesis/export protein